MAKFICKSPPVTVEVAVGSKKEVYTFVNEEPVEVSSIAARILSRKEEFEKVE